MQRALILVSAGLLAACGDDEHGGWPSDAGVSHTIDGGLLDASVADSGARDAAGDARVQLADANALNCGEADQMVNQLLSSDPTLNSLRACASENDCSALSISFTCNGNPDIVHLDYCATAIATAKGADTMQWLSDLEAQLCPRITTGCRSSADCSPGIPRCVNNVCAIVAD